MDNKHDPAAGIFCIIIQLTYSHALCPINLTLNSTGSYGRRCIHL